MQEGRRSLAKTERGLGTARARLGAVRARLGAARARLAWGGFTAGKKIVRGGAQFFKKTLILQKKSLYKSIQPDKKKM